MNWINGLHFASIGVAAVAWVAAILVGVGAIGLACEENANNPWRNPATIIAAASAVIAVTATFLAGATI
ncbi:MAG: hypothetical protein E6719_00045 [Dermabacter sp.]|nr:hypothetical protein [Dermabacter sp.]